MGQVDIQNLDSKLRFEILLRAARQVDRKFKRATEATAVGFGRRRRAGELLSDEWCIRFYVPRKLKRPGVSRQVPPALSLRVQVEGNEYRVNLPTDVLQHAKSVRPTVPGFPFIFSGSTPTSPGCATALVQRQSTGQQFLLTAAHVALSAGSPLNDASGATVGTVVYVSDVSASGLDVALATITGPAPQNLVPRSGGNGITAICAMDQLPAQDPNSFQLLASRDTLLAVFDGVVASVTLQYPTGSVTFLQLLHFDCACMGGDSGAMMVDPLGRAVGMHIAGDEQENWSYVSPIGRILDNGYPTDRLALSW